jgi:hypothetical protein
MRDAAAMAAQSDPDRNPHFRRRWGPPDLRSGPRIVPTIQRAKFEVSSSENMNSAVGCLHQLASRLDRQADYELALGHHTIAERLSRHAAELREVKG